MAARANAIGRDAGRSEIIDLRNVAARDLDPLLIDEIREWREDLAWDFAPSADLVRRYAGTSSLGGAALLVNGEIAGYGYAVLEEPRAIIGDVYVRPQYRSADAEAELFHSLLEALSATPRVSRMESQLMLVSPEAARIVGNQKPLRDQPVRLFERRLMRLDATTDPQPPADAAVHGRFRIEPWSHHYLHTAGAIISDSYHGTIDSEINAQYRSPAGARRFLSNIVEYPGCGNFHAGASFLAFDPDTGRAAGMVLASFVANDAGHVSQLCVVPEARERGLGRELLRCAATALYSRGAACVSLTVTAANLAAISMYEKLHFRNVRGFFAYIWEA